MNPFSRTARRALAPSLMGTLLVASVLVPLLDRGMGGETPALETEHHPATCVRSHDHTICTQVGANLWAPVPDGPTTADPPKVRLLEPPPSHGLATLTRTEGNPSRAPPGV